MSEDEGASDYHFRSHSELLDKVKTYYPEQYNTYGLDQAVAYGFGTQAYVYRLNDRVWKFTTSKDHARVASLIARDKSFIHLVRTDYVWHLPALKVWCAVEHLLKPLDRSQVVAVNNWRNKGADIPRDIVSMLYEFNEIGLMGWDDDCLHPHNLMQDASGRIVAHDFGYTTCSYPEMWTAWT